MAEVARQFVAYLLAAVFSIFAWREPAETAAPDVEPVPIMKEFCERAGSARYKRARACKLFPASVSLDSFLDRWMGPCCIDGGVCYEQVVWDDQRMSECVAGMERQDCLDLSDGVIPRVCRD